MGGTSRRLRWAGAAAALMITPIVVALPAAPAGAVPVNNEAEFRAAWTNPATTSIEVGVSFSLTNCGAGVPTRNSGTALTVTATGRPHTITQTCANTGVLVQQGGGALTFDGITLTGGRSPNDGGAISTAALSNTFNNSTITGNTSGGEGGGISAQTMNAVVTLNDSIVSGNGAAFAGGGISVNGANGALVANRSQITGNRSGNVGNSAGGGAISGLRLTITDTLVSGNQANSNGIGGGLASQLVTATRSLITGNLAGRDGGGIVGNNVTLTNTTVMSNQALRSGGGISAGGFITLSYATITSNRATAGFAANIATNDTGELRSFGSVIVQPFAGQANCTTFLTTTSSSYSYSDDASCKLTRTGDRQNAANPQLGALADNGGFTSTRLPADASPLVDVIPGTACPTSITDDQRGVRRPQGGTCDIGAVELALAPGAGAPIGADPLVVDPTFTG